MKYWKWMMGALMMALVSIMFVATAGAQGGDVTRGATLFAANCAVCHGDRAQGRVGATLAKDFPAIRVNALLKQTIANGVAGSVMPAWSTAKGGPLTDPQIEDIAAFIQSLSHQAPTVIITRQATNAPTLGRPSPAATMPPGNAERGARIFAENCAVCHGARGEGRIGASLQKDFPSVNVQAALDATIARGVTGTKMPAWSKAFGGPLTDQEIADAATFIRSLKKPVELPAPTESIPQGGNIGGWLGLLCFGGVVVIGALVLWFGLASARGKSAPPAA